jgi:hypothetical protein
MLILVLRQYMVSLQNSNILLKSSTLFALAGGGVIAEGSRETYKSFRGSCATEPSKNFWKPFMGARFMDAGRIVNENLQGILFSLHHFTGRSFSNSTAKQI